MEGFGSGFSENKCRFRKIWSWKKVSILVLVKIQWFQHTLVEWPDGLLLRSRLPFQKLDFFVWTIKSCFEISPASSDKLENSASSSSSILGDENIMKFFFTSQSIQTKYFWVELSISTLELFFLYNFCLSHVQLYDVFFYSPLKPLSFQSEWAVTLCPYYFMSVYDCIILVFLTFTDLHKITLPLHHWLPGYLRSLWASPYNETWVV